MVKQAGVAAWLIGIAAVIAITAWSGLEAVGHAVASVGWGILLVVVVRGVTVAVAGAGWWLIFPPQTRPRLRICVLLRFVREATNVLLPMAQVGGDVIGAGLLRLYGVPGSLAAASVIVDVLLQAATQFVFAIVGLLLLIALGADATLAWVAATGLGLGGAHARRLLSGATSRRATHSARPSSGALLATGSGGCSARSMPSTKTSPRSTPVVPISLPAPSCTWPAGSSASPRS